MQIEHFLFLNASAVKRLIATFHSQSMLRTEIRNRQLLQHTSNVYWHCYDSERFSISTAWSSGNLFQSTVLHDQGENIVHINIMIRYIVRLFNPLNPKLNPICSLLALLGAHHFLYVSRIRVKLLIFRLLMSCIYGAPILDVSRSHTTTQHSR